MDALSLIQGPGLPSWGALRDATSANGGFTNMTRRQKDFASTLARQHAGHGVLPSRQEQARESAEEFVAMALIQPILGQLRSTNAAAPPFQPTQGEKSFQTMVDAHLARQIVRSGRFPLVDRVARDLLKRTDSAGTGAGAGASDPGTAAQTGKAT